MNDRIARSLERLFEVHRIVIWTDAKREMADVYDALALEGVEKITLANDEFGVKYRILREAPTQKFLIYRGEPEPAMIDNWLLDVQLAGATFTADMTAMQLADLGLPMTFEAAVRAHEEFFRSRVRIEALKKILRPEDTVQAFRLRLLAVATDAEGGLDTVLEGLLADLATGVDTRMKLVERVGLTAFLWDRIGHAYGYVATTPDIEDFAITLFKSCYAAGLGEDAPLTAEALLLFKRWMANKKGAVAFEALSTRYTVEGADLIGIRNDLQSRDFRGLMEIDYFEEIDREIIRSLVRELSAETAKPGDVLGWIRMRRQSHWYDRFADIYEAIGHATSFQQALAEANLGMTDLSEGVRRYAKTWFRIDQQYRKFIFHMQRSGQASLLSALYERVENLYVNSFLLPLNDAWQVQVDRAETWTAPGIERQSDFYRNQVGAFRRKDQKVCVVISDALRFEIAEELAAQIRTVDRFDAELTPMLGSLPSYTQLGMASLLPHDGLRIADDKDATVFSGAQSSQGLVNRQKLLETGRAGDRVRALKADDLMAMHRDDARELIKNHDVIYIYHNEIDATGDKLVSEERAFGAVEDTIENLVKLVRKLASANAKAILITADHGFIYQNRAIEESDFSVAEPDGETIHAKNRRFVTGQGLIAVHGLRKFTSSALGLAGDIEVLISNSINRMRRSGSGSRFVHGGASLQEVVTPVLRVSKSRISDITQVEVEIIVNGRSTITSGQISVMLYQVQTVTEKMRPRTLRAGLYALSGELISDVHEITFDISSENPRDREAPTRFLLSRAADQFNTKDVVLRLDERHGSTSHYQEYRTHRYTLRRGITADFDF